MKNYHNKESALSAKYKSFRNAVKPSTNLKR